MTGEKKTTAITYRDIPAINQSGLAKFDDDPILFYRQYILGETIEDKPSTGMDIGSLVDFILLDCNTNIEEAEHRLSEKFAITSTIRTTAQAFDLADELFKIAKSSTDEEGKINRQFDNMFKEAFDVVVAQGKYKKKTWEYALSDFDKTARGYYNDRIQAEGKTVVNTWEIEKSKHIVLQGLNDEFHGEFLRSSGENIINKLVVQFSYPEIDMKCKMEQDRTVIDHENKLIRRYDYKCRYDNEEFDYLYLKSKYYLQNAFYHIGTEIWAEQNGMEDYDVLPMEFLVFDSSVNSRRPLLYQTTYEMVEEGWAGFTTASGRRYRGTIDLMRAVKWASETGIWNISHENYLNNARISMTGYGV